jgi:hypothetical protein
MTFAPMTIPGVSGEISTTYSFWTGYRFFVDGQRVKPRGFLRNRLTLPGAAGPVEAKIKGGAFRAHPVLVVGDGEYTTGPPTPRLLQALGVLPVLSIVVFQGLLGFALAFGGVAINMSVIRSARSDRAKIALMSATFVTIAVIDTVLVVALVSATG